VTSVIGVGAVVGVFAALCLIGRAIMGLREDARRYAGYAAWLERDKEGRR
jgi:hypothetical protein